MSTGPEEFHFRGLRFMAGPTRNNTRQNDLMPYRAYIYISFFSK